MMGITEREGLLPAQELRKVSWRKWEPRYVKKEEDGWKVIPAGRSDTAKTRQMLGE